VPVGHDDPGLFKCVSSRYGRAPLRDPMIISSVGWSPTSSPFLPRGALYRHRLQGAAKHRIGGDDSPACRLNSHHRLDRSSAVRSNYEHARHRATRTGAADGWTSTHQADRPCADPGESTFALSPIPLRGIVAVTSNSRQGGKSDTSGIPKGNRDACSASRRQSLRIAIWHSARTSLH
jgi:hypothetical protein